jgi:hypothetical protein
MTHSDEWVARISFRRPTDVGVQYKLHLECDGVLEPHVFARGNETAVREVAAQWDADLPIRWEEIGAT